MTVNYEFNTVLDRHDLSTMKWEAEIARTGRQDLISLGTADMDFRSPPEVVEALVACAHRGHFGYPWKSPAYFEAITSYLERHFCWRIEPSWIQSATGVYASMQPLLDALTQSGDEVIFQTPVHHIFNELVTSMGRKPVQNPLKTDGIQYFMDLDDLERRITSKTKVLLLCSPHNPMGRIWTRTELEALYDVCLRRNVIVLSDEIYCGLLYPGESFVPAASISKEASLSTVTLISASKAFNLTGLKHSVVIAENPALREGFKREQGRSNMYYGGSIFGQVATEVALRSCDQWSEQLMEYVRANFEYVRDGLMKLFPKAICYRPESTYFLWIDLRAYGCESQQLVAHLEKEAGLIVSGGHALGSGGEGHVRINLGCPRVLLEEVLRRLERVELLPE